MSVRHKAELTPEIEGKYYSPKMQWWCNHTELRDENGVESSLYLWPALGSLDEAWICSLHFEDRIVDMTELHLPVDTFKTSRSGVEVNFGNQYIRGTYPDYEIYVEGDDNGTPLGLKISLKALVPPFEALPNLRGITWHYVPRFAVTGVMMRGGEELSVAGSGYLERRRGRFWSPGIDRGLWESVPAPGNAPFSIPLFYKVWKQDGSTQLQTLTFTVDGNEMVDFEEVEVDMLETITVPGFEEIQAPSRFRLTARGDDGEAQLEVIRQDHRLALRNYFDDPDPRAEWAGMYGAGHTTGAINFRGKSYPVDGNSYGSALFFSGK